MRVALPVPSALRNFLRSEAFGGVALIVAAALAMIVANSPWAETYVHALHAEIGPVLSPKLSSTTG